MRVRLVLVLAGLLIALAHCATGNCAETDSADSHNAGPNWHVQRLLVPAERPEEWPRDKTQRYLPMQLDEFEQRLAHLRKPSARSAEVSPARLVSADYSATLSGNNLVDGEAVWQFESHGKEKTVLLLDGCQLSLSDSSWTDAPQRAVVGNDQYGRLAVVVERSGKLRSGWSLRGRQSSAENLTFDLQLPACPVSTMHLTLPAERIVQVDHGLAAPDGLPQHGQQRWLIDLGGNHRVILQIGMRNLVGEEHPLMLVQSSQAFDLSQRGLKLSAELRLNIVGPPLHKLSLQFDEPLSPVRAQIGNVELPITLIAGDGKGAARAEIEFPEPLQSSGHRLRITAVAPIAFGQRWRLPMVHVPEARWQEGDATLRVAAPLVIDDLACKDGRQIKSEPLPGSIADEAIVMQCFGESPGIDVIVSHRQERIRLESGVSISLRANECTGRSLADFSVLDGERFSLEAEVAPQWIIDNVESDSPGRIVDWSHEALPGKPGKLKLQLRTPLSPQHDLRLLVIGRRRRAPLGERLHLADLEMLCFADAEVTRRLIHLQAVDPYQLQLTGADSLHYLDPAQLGPADAAVLEENPAGLVFVDDAQSRAVSVSLSLRPPRYEADIQAEVVAHDSKLTENYRFSIVPQGREMTRLIVRFSQPRAEPVAWEIDGEDSTALRARRLTEPEQAASGPTEGEAWEVLLPTPRATPFEIHAVRESPLRGETPVALAALGAAEAQRGSVLVRSTGAAAPELRSRRLPTLPVDLPATGKQSTALAAFRYEPEEDTLQVAEPPLVLVPRGEQAAANPAWIWQAHLDSRFQRGGGEHFVTYQIENTGRSQVEFRLPDGAQLRAAWIDAQSVTNTLLHDGTRFEVSLPVGARFVTVALQWTDDNASCRRTISTSSAPWPKCDLPTLQRQWTVSVPMGFAVPEAEIGGRPAIVVSWAARLFGPLARTTDAYAESSIAAEQPAHKTAWLQSPWKSGEHNSPSGREGWNTYQFDDSTDSPGKIWIADQHSLSAWAWAVFVLVVGFGWWLGRQRILWIAAAVGALTALALLAPAALAPIGAAAWMGFIVGKIAAWIRQPASSTATAKPSASESTSKTKKLAAATAVGLIAICAVHNAVRADESPSSSAASHASEIRQVLIPIDQQQHPTGGLCYLPESFYEELVRATADAKIAKPQYLITRATYKAQIGRDAATSDLTSGDWQTTFDIDSLAEGAVMQFPFDSQGAALVPEGIKIDDKAASFHWEQKQHSLAIELGSPGRRHLEVLLRPKHRRGGFDFSIPVAANAQIDLTTSTPAALELQTALGTALAQSSTKDAPAGGKAIIELLGPANQIVLRSQDLASAGGSAKTSSFDVDELYWLHIRPGSITIDGRFRLKTREGQVQRLRLLTDSRLRPLSTAGNYSVKTRRVSGELSELTIDLPSASTNETTIDIPFLLDGVSGIGELRLPRLQVEGAAGGRRWWAANFDSALELNESLASGDQTLPPSQFAELWGAADVKPQFAFDRTAASDDWKLSTRPREIKSISRNRLALNVGVDSVGVRFAANVASQGGQAFQYRLAVPAELQIDDLTIEDQHGQQPAHWARIGNELLSVMLTAPVTGEIKLLVRGRLPRSKDATLSVPEFSVQGSENEKFRAIITRGTDVLVAVSEQGGLKIVTPSEVAAAIAEAQHDGLIEQLHAGEEQLVAVLEGSQAPPSAVLNVTPNRPKIQAAQATSISRNADAWQATVDLSLKIEDGVLDVLRFEMPTQWNGPFKITPPMPSSVIELPGLNRRQLVMYPEAPLSGTTHLHIVGPLTVAGGERPAAPDIHLVGTPYDARYFLLPRRIEDQQLSWDTRGLRPKPLPEELAAIVSDAASYRSYQLLASRSRAILRSAERTAEDPQVRLADISTSFQNDGQCWGVAAYDLEPAGATNCVLELPEGLQLVHALLDGIPAQRVGQGENHWNIWLGDNKLPRRLEVVFAGHPSSSVKIDSLPAPQLVDLPVERTLWSISAPHSFGPATLRRESSISQLRHELLRYEATTALADSAAGLLLEESPENLNRWYAPWAKRFLDSRAALNRFLTTGAEDNSAANAAEEISTIEQDQVRLARRLGTSNLMSQMAAEPVIASDPLRLWSMEQGPRRELSFALGRSDSGPPSVDYPQRQTDDRWLRFIASGLILLAVATWAIARRKGLLNFKFPPQQRLIGTYLWGVIAAVVWWLWLTPRFVALIILAASVSVIVRHVWPTRPTAVWPTYAVSSRAISNPGSSRTRI